MEGSIVSITKEADGNSFGVSKDREFNRVELIRQCLIDTVTSDDKVLNIRGTHSIEKEYMSARQTQSKGEHKDIKTSKKENKTK